ncbi:amidohydrolase family protein [Rhizobium sp. Root149]|uniref:amidohydrolase family protein n=1 Tax=Rhizobium sp. Root149 TaxID=1736473 RepID=UPI000A3E7560|nr:amidohydrolase family protein [Rhizobium sp. Root149]
MMPDSGRYLVDAHHHFQDIETYDYPWLKPDRPQALEGDLSAIRRNFLPDEYREIVSGWPVRKSVHVQNGWRADDPVGETRWLSSLIEAHDLPMVIVGYADLAAPTLAETLRGHLAYPQVRGIRQILNWHEDLSLRVAATADVMEMPDWRRGFANLADHGLSFDLQIYWPQMEMALELAQDFPGTQIILDHFGMPIDRSTAALRHWMTAIYQLASAENVSVKLSGFGLGHPHWSRSDTVPLLQSVIRAFGAERVMFGSNLPVDLLFSKAQRIVEAFEAAIRFLSEEDKSKVRHGNAERVYRF